jgi:hypothetical protein
MNWNKIHTKTMSTMFNGPTMKKFVMHLLKQALLIVCEFKKCHFILMHSTNLDHFQLTALTLMWTAFWLIDTSGEKGK